MLRCFSTYKQSFRSLSINPLPSRSVQYRTIFKKRSGPEVPFQLERFENMNGTPKGSLEKYQNLSREELIAKIEKLEGRGGLNAIPSSSKSIKEENQNDNNKTPNKKAKTFDISRYPCRKIALRFSYDGEQYSGLEIQPVSGSFDGTQIETVEGVLWRALCEARLVDDQIGMQGVSWSRCGRTDRGVSAAGQVVAFWTRSKKVDQWPLRKIVQRVMDETQSIDIVNDEGGETDNLTRQSWRDRIDKKMKEFLVEEERVSNEREDRIHADPNSEELPFIVSINRLLPKSIRVQAWSPVSPAFNARFDCQYRHYKYFFSRGAPFSNIYENHNHGPIPPLDIHSMRIAAQKFLGEHDFRNFCRVDPSKQMDNFTRRIDGISIDPVTSSWPNTSNESKQLAKEEEQLTLNPNNGLEQMYVLNLRGTAFLYHQVRHITAILFLVGAGLEKPSIVDELLNVRSNGVYVDRLLAAKVSGLMLDENAEDLQTVLPKITSDRGEKESMVQKYQKARSELNGESNVESVKSVFDANHISHHEHLQNLYVYDRKPIYEMAMDRPLMLWECGFSEKEIQWRSGVYDGPMNLKEIQNIDNKKALDINGPTSLIRAQMHAIWDAQKISSEMYKHFALALPSDAEEGKLEKTGYIPSNTEFSLASFPALQSEILDEKAAIQTANQQNGINPSPSSCSTKAIIPLGYGRFKTAPQYTSLRNAGRQSTPEEKNQKWKETRGQRRAEKVAAKKLLKESERENDLTS